MEFQEGFSYPYFTLTEAVLDHLELGPPEGNLSNYTVHYYHPGHDTWMKQAVNSVITLTKPSQTLFLKATNVTSFPSFDRHFAAAATPVSQKDSTFRHGPLLSEERRHVRQTRTKMRAGVSQTLGDMLEISSDDEVQDDSLPVLNTQKRRSDSQPEALLSQRRRCDSESDDDGMYFCQ